MKTMCPSCYYHNGFMETHALGHMMNHKSCAQMHELPQGPEAKKNVWMSEISALSSKMSR